MLTPPPYQPCALKKEKKGRDGTVRRTLVGHIQAAEQRVT